jgi:hypothetical protein
MMLHKIVLSLSLVVLCQSQAVNSIAPSRFDCNHLRVEAIDPFLSYGSKIALVPVGSNFPQKFQTVTAPPVQQFDPSWLPVPLWMSGTWRAKAQTILQAYSFIEQRATVTQPVQISINRITKIGTQSDDSGQIWHFTGAPYTRTIETPSYVEQQQVERIIPLGGGERKFVIKTDAVVTQVKKETGEVLEIFREITTTTYKPINDGLIEVSFEVIDLDLTGRAKRSSKSVCYDVRIKPFRPIKADERGNLELLFKDFIRRRGQ